MTTPENPDQRHTPGGSPAGPDSWVAHAIAEQEEHLRRVRSCTGINNSHADAHPGLSHSWDSFSTAPGGPKYEACWRCRVTRTPADYAIKEGAAE